MKTKTIDGITFVKDYHTTAWMRLKKSFARFIGYFMVGTSVSIFVVAGFFSANVLLTIH